MMQSADLKVGSVYAIKAGTASWRSSHPAMLLSTFLYDWRNEAFIERPTRPTAASPLRRLGWGLPVLAFDPSNRKIEERIAHYGITAEQFEIAPQTVQLMGGLSASITVYPARNFVCSWADKLLADERYEERRRVEQEQQEQRDRQIGEYRAELTVLLTGIDHLVQPSGAVTIYSAEKLIELLRTPRSDTRMGSKSDNLARS